MLTEKIKALKIEKDAVILAHYYQTGDVQDIADYVGDSLELSRIAAATDKKMIVFCGVNFMAETAKILSPDKKVLLPVEKAGCPMAMMINKKRLEDYRRANPERIVVCYVNSYAEVKALSDVCVTSSNAEKIVKHFRDKKMLYIPDKNLGSYVKKKYNLDMELWPGYCHVHNNLNLADVEKAREEHPDALFLVHPEAPLAVIEQADFVGSTKGIIEYASASDKKRFIIGTEQGILHPLKKNNPDKEFFPLSTRMTCYNMKYTTLEDVYNALLNETHEITIDPEIQKAAKKSLDLMLELS
ncbi:MAG: quinolinate synthase NadA [Bacilli bacterium]|nr:quinolinate synthase NadA [Bacilli bacterium]MBN2696778.1 quinolinate synthase NadA [Bacilli bacterium]